MILSGTFAEKVLEFNRELAGMSPALPAGYRAVNPLAGAQQDAVRQITSAFYQRYYGDVQPRQLILGSSPARRGTAVTGVPFEDAQVLKSELGFEIEGYAIGSRSSGFLEEVISRCGGRERFYSSFFMNFVCPVGLVRTSPKGNEVNCNYYDGRSLKDALRPFIVDTLRHQLALGVDPSVCFCIGSGENFKFLLQVNQAHGLFERIIPLEHPRFITQYHPARRDDFVEKYVQALRGAGA